MWFKGVIGIWFLAFIDLTTFPINVFPNDVERTSPFYVSALPSTLQYSHESDLSRVYISSRNKWNKVVNRFKRQDEPVPENAEDVVVDDVEGSEVDSELVPEAVEESLGEETQIESEDGLDNSETNLDSVDEGDEESDNTEEIPVKEVDDSEADSEVVTEADKEIESEEVVAEDNVVEDVEEKTQTNSEDVTDGSESSLNAIDGGVAVSEEVPNNIISTNDENEPDISDDALTDQNMEEGITEVDNEEGDAIKTSDENDVVGNETPLDGLQHEVEEQKVSDDIGVSDNVEFILSIGNDSNIDGLDMDYPENNNTDENIALDTDDEILTSVDSESGKVESTLESPIIEVTTTPTTSTTTSTTTTTPTTTVAPCTHSKFGCCKTIENNLLEAHGRRQEGCCLSSEFGCCPDFITPAIGNNFEGCDCAETEFGCCENLEENDDEIEDYLSAEQNDTIVDDLVETTTENIGKAARDDKKKGCGCHLSPHGCCPDQYTPAEGSDIAKDCPCYTQAYGCCPDGKTAAEGPHLEGCNRCENTTYCCPDNFTPSQGPDGEGCDCAGSEFGCCPDGHTLATGSNFSGCNEIPGEQCHLPKDNGNCKNTLQQNFTMRWFFDTTYGGCSNFWWSGDCGQGVVNRFKRQDEPVPEDAEDVVVGDVEGSEVDSEVVPEVVEESVGEEAQIESEDGLDNSESNLNSVDEGDEESDNTEEVPVKEVEDSEADSEVVTEADKEVGRTNRFLDLQTCEKMCVKPPGSGGCYLPKVEGQCEERIGRWYYDRNLNECRNFTYGGCLGNLNRFESKKSCEASCGKVSQDLGVCSQPVQPGPCRGEYPRWYYDDSEGVCKAFNYTGCMGNDNRFSSKKNCENACTHHSKVIKGKVICSKSKPKNVGWCSQEQRKAKWYFNADSKTCQPFYYENCQANENVPKVQENENMFDSQEECETICPNTFPPNIIIENKEVVTENGKDALLQISVDANPPATISWEFEGEAVQLENIDEQSGRTILKLEDGSLKIIKTTLNDAGIWTIVADNNLGQIARKNVLLEVTPERMPVMATIDKSTTTFIVGTNIVLACDVKGYPVPKIQWYKNNTPLRASDKIAGVNGGELTVSKVGLIDKGSYKCKALNVHESASDLIVVVVESSKGEPIQICDDSPQFANCELIVKANFCKKSPYYAKFCCKSCTDAGQL